METHLTCYDGVVCDICKRNDGEVWDNEVTVRGVQLIRFNAHIECKKKMFRLLQQWN